MGAPDVKGGRKTKGNLPFLCTLATGQMAVLRPPTAGDAAGMDRMMRVARLHKKVAAAGFGRGGKAK